jgi:hypothetical protein
VSYGGSDPRIEQLLRGRSPFLSGPGELLCFHSARLLLEVPEWRGFFGEYIDGYYREDYGIRNLPALRFYSDKFESESQSWWLDGNVDMDVLLPPSLRRGDLQKVSDVVVAALLQQFRRDSFLEGLRLVVPGLNYYGRGFHADKNKAWQPASSESELIPMAAVSLNFRVDLREWDAYLESADRTVDDPFRKTLKTLASIGTIIRAGRGEQAVEIGIDQPAGSEPLLTESGDEIETEDGGSILT